MARRRRNKRSALVASSMLAAGCGPAAKPADVTPPVVHEPAQDPARAIARYVVHHDRFVRRTLYTWTTSEQIDELRRTRKLLSRDESPDSGGSYIDQVLYALAQSGHPLAQLLHTTSYAKMRFAWPVAWATRMGWPGENYGDQLIRVTLRPDAVLLRLSTATGTFEARDMHGGTVALDDVVTHPERIAAIYFISDATAPPATGIPPATGTYREFVLCNEAMIESWAVGTDDIKRELEDEADALDALARHVRRHPGDRVPVATAWPVTDDRDQQPGYAYSASLAFDSENYPLDAEAIAQIAAALRSDVPAVKPFTGGGTATFPGIGPARGAPRVVPVIGRGTWARVPGPTAAHAPPSP